jgi:hypothetical protein
MLLSLSQKFHGYNAKYLLPTFTSEDTYSLLSLPEVIYDYPGGGALWLI